MVSLKGYWTKLRDILKAQSFLYFILLIILLLIIAFIPLVLPPTDIIASILIITFFSTFILQSLFFYGNNVSPCICFGRSLSSCLLLKSGTRFIRR